MGIFEVFRLDKKNWIYFNLTNKKLNLVKLNYIILCQMLKPFKLHLRKFISTLIHLDQIFVNSLITTKFGIPCTSLKYYILIII